MTDSGVSYGMISIAGGAIRLVLLLVMVALLVLAIVTRKRYPRSAPFLILGFAALVLDDVLGLVWPFVATALSSAGAGYRLGLLAVDLLTGLASLAGLVLLGLALFLRRPPEQPAATPPTALPMTPPPAGPPPAPYYGTQPNAPQPGPAGPPPPPPAQPGPGGAAPLWPGTPPN